MTVTEQGMTVDVWEMADGMQGVAMGECEKTVGF